MAGPQLSTRTSVWIPAGVLSATNFFYAAMIFSGF